MAREMATTENTGKVVLTFTINHRCENITTPAPLTIVLFFGPGYGDTPTEEAAVAALEEVAGAIRRGAFDLTIEVVKLERRTV
jgi:hypothetical protein